VYTLLEEITSNELDIVHPAESENGPKPARKKGKFSKVFGVRSTVSTTTVSVPERLKREVDMYVQYPVLDIDSSPLEWWRLEWKRMPILAVVARKYLCNKCYLSSFIMYYKMCS